MTYFKSFSAILLAMLLAISSVGIAFAAKNSTVKGMRFWQSPDRTRVVLDLSEPVKENVFILKTQIGWLLIYQKPSLD